MISNNPFKQMEPNRDLPGRLKDRVMRDVNYLKFFADVAELFSIKYAATIQNVFLTDVGKRESSSEQ